MGVVPAVPGFLEGLRTRCDARGALLVFDEVITGFRVGPGGASTRLGITPDLSLFGKVVGGGLPLAAVGGRAAFMDQLAPLGPVYQAGTLSGNPLATAAGLAALAQLDAAAYDALEARAVRLADGLRSAMASAPAQVVRAHTLVGLFFAAAPVHDYETARASDTTRYAQWFHGMLDRGVYVAPSAFETMFPSLAHTDADIDRTVEAAAKAVAALV
jgi:glutamate-1-semialdehyde 2,1-aminomutase